MAKKTKAEPKQEETKTVATVKSEIVEIEFTQNCYKDFCNYPVGYKKLIKASDFVKYKGVAKIIE